MAFIKDLLEQAKHAGIDGVFRILRYTIIRDRIDHAYETKKSAFSESSPLPPGKLIQMDAQTGGAIFTYQNARLEVGFLAQDLIRLTWFPGEEPAPYAIDKSAWVPVTVSVNEIPDGVSIQSAALSLNVSKDGSMSFANTAGDILRRVRPPELHHTYEGISWTDHCDLQPEEALYGLGERAGRLDWRGETRWMWNSDPYGAYRPGDDPLYMPMPVYLGLHNTGSYLVFYENYHPATFTSGRRKDDPTPPLVVRSERSGRTANEFIPQVNDELTAEFEGGALRSYFIAGTLPGIIERFTELTGRPPLPPRWALGYHQSRWSYMNTAEVRQVAQGFVARDLPLGVIHLDIDYMDGFRVFTVDKTRFPDLPGLAQELEQMGIKLVSILDPGVKRDPEYFVYREGLQRNAFCKTSDSKILNGVVWPGWSVFPDFTDPQVRQWWADYYPRLLSQGIAGIWHDMNEPTSFTGWGGPYLPQDLQHAMDGRRANHRRGHNVYALQMARAGFEGLHKHAPDRRPWLVSRSGWVSLARYSWNWTGDSHTSWDSLRLVGPIVMSTGLCGQPYNGPDVGGFSGDPPAELYLRYFQIAAFLPFFRTHSAFFTRRREPWVFGEPYTSIIRQFLKLRYRLMPYFYSLAWLASQKGCPLVRPLWWLDASDRRLWSREDAFMLGDDILVAPLVEASSTRRMVDLPAGCWYDFWNDILYTGPSQVEIESGIEHIPVLIRAGAILPLEDKGRLELHVYAPPLEGHTTPTHSGEAESDFRFELYSDDGDGYGPSRVDCFSLRFVEGGLEVNWEPLDNARGKTASGASDRTEGNTRGNIAGIAPWPYTRVDLVLHGKASFVRWGSNGGPI